jgi:hypothetical protein
LVENAGKSFGTSLGRAQAMTEVDRGPEMRQQHLQQGALLPLEIVGLRRPAEHHHEMRGCRRMLRNQAVKAVQRAYHLVVLLRADVVAVGDQLRPYDRLPHWQPRRRRGVATLVRREGADHLVSADSGTGQQRLAAVFQIVADQEDMVRPQQPDDAFQRRCPIFRRQRRGV